MGSQRLNFVLFILYLVFILLLCCVIYNIYVFLEAVLRWGPYSSKALCTVPVPLSLRAEQRRDPKYRADKEF